MKVVIVGAGLGGLACAIACRRENINVEILERSADIREVGAGIQIPPNGTRIMRDLGLLHELLKKGSIVQHVDFRRYKDGQLLRSMPFGDDIETEFGVPWVIIHRADYHRLLFDEAIRLGVKLRLGATVEDINFNPEGPQVILAGGEKVIGDIIIGADGLWSRVRDIILGELISPEETGDLAYRATFTREQLEALNNKKINELCQKVAVTSWLGPDKHTIFYPVRGGQEFNLVLLCPDNLAQGTHREKADLEEMQESYAEWDETLQKIITCVPSVYKWKLTHLPELPSWTKGPVTLLGDACHPTLPYQAQGAAMAVEDGATIGKLLGLFNAHYRDDPSQPMPQSTRESIPSILDLYEQIRKPRTTRNVRGAIVNRKLFHMDDGVLQMMRDFLLRYTGVTKKSDWMGFFSYRMKQTLGYKLLWCDRAFRDFESRGLLRT